MLRRIPGVLAAVSVLGGCADEPPPAPPEMESQSLVNHHVWEYVPEADDPLADHRPEETLCQTWGPEGLGVEVETTGCNYFAVRQPSLIPVPEGAMISVAVSHFDLIAPEDAEAHLAVLIDGELIWERTIVILAEPTEDQEAGVDAGVQREDFPAPFDIPVGAEVMFHLHNHGYNSYNLFKLNGETPVE